jgi:predicted acylesterase/phospholipase RssA
MDIDLIDIMMASAALPIAFPPRIIPGLGNTTWIDGGTGKLAFHNFIRLLK